jgi:4a-hydroxytetrahydrobiopterin dehydratase
MIELKEKHCVPCEGGTKPFDGEEIKRFKKLLAPGWRVVEDKKMQKEFPFENFKRGMAFAQDIAAIAESENHHPDICIHYTNVELELSTHAIGGLSENDFIMAAKIDEL